MTQDLPKFVGPTEAVKRTIADLRKRQGWTAADLAKECEVLGMPELNRSVIANIESGRRSYVTVDELCCLAFALDVAPVHLLVPFREESELFQPAPKVGLPLRDARKWFRGQWLPRGRDARLYFANVPADEFRSMPATAPGKSLDMTHQLEGKPPKRVDDGG